MTNTMTMNQPVSLQMAASGTAAHRLNRADREQIRRRRRRAAVISTLLEGLATIGLATCFVLCAVMIVCAM